MSPSPSARFLLAVDTSGADAGVALAGGGRTEVARLPVVGSAARTEDLAEVTSRLLASRSAAADGLSAVAGVVGPGSYTGLRSGLAFLRGIAFGLSIPAVAVGSLELLARRTAGDGESLAAALPLAEGRHVVAAYRFEAGNIRELSAPVVVADLQTPVFEGVTALTALAVAAVDDAARALAARLTLPLREAAGDRLEALASLAAVRAAAGEFVPVDALLPVYVGQSSAKPNRNRVAVTAAE